MEKSKIAAKQFFSSINELTGRLVAIFPYLWPKNDTGLVLRFVAFLVLLIVGRIVVMIDPICNKLIIDSLSFDSGKVIQLRWDLLLLDFGLRITRSLARSLRGKLWVEVENKISKGIAISVYEHLHNLSLRWHLSRKTAEVTSIVDQGANSASSVLRRSSVVSSVMNGCLNGLMAVLHLPTVLIIKYDAWCTQYRKGTLKKERKTLQQRIDSLLNYETVKHNSTEEYELRRYTATIDEHANSRKYFLDIRFYVNFARNSLAETCSFIAALSCAYLIVNKYGYTVGDFTLITTSVWTIYGSLTRLGWLYADISNTVLTQIDKLLELLAEEPEVKDHPEARDYQIQRGQIDFKNVCFHYSPEKPILKNVTFVVKPGSTVALVGPTGSGKSSIMRLLFRFFDVQSGEVLFDGQDVKMLRQKSLRLHIGVVPQDTVLFNESIRYNIQYGRLEATDTQVEEAAKAAQIHDAILTFPNGYDTEVGERGLKLSGGEKQRVAIARTILRAPDFIFLDEATSALDTDTERKIRRSIRNVCRGKTTVIVAHRLSTIVHADEILVLKEGEIIERGKHEQLLQDSCSLYSKMWNQQLRRDPSIE